MKDETDACVLSDKWSVNSDILNISKLHVRFNHHICKSTSHNNLLTIEYSMSLIQLSSIWSYDAHVFHHNSPTKLKPPVGCALNPAGPGRNGKPWKRRSAPKGTPRRGKSRVKLLQSRPRLWGSLKRAKAVEEEVLRWNDDRGSCSNQFFAILFPWKWNVVGSFGV